MSENNERISNQVKEVKEETVETAKKIKETRRLLKPKILYWPCLMIQLER